MFTGDPIPCGDPGCAACGDGDPARCDHRVGTPRTPPRARPAHRHAPVAWRGGVSWSDLVAAAEDGDATR